MARQIDLQLDNDDLVDINITNDEGESVHVIRLDTSDTETPIRFANLLKNVTAISEQVEADEQELKKKFAHVKEGEYDYDKVVETSRFHIESLEKIIYEINEVFGENCIETVYAEHYELNPDYVPDEYALMEFLEKLIPLMNSIYGQRFEAKNKKYNVQRRGKGKHNLSKEDLIKQQMGK